MDEYARDLVKQAIRRRFEFVDFARIHFISALHGTGVGNLFDSVLIAYQSAFKSISTSRLNQILSRIQSTHQPPLINGRRIKLRYAHVGGHNPPIFVIHGKQTDELPDSYVRYLEKTFENYLSSKVRQFVFNCVMMKILLLKTKRILIINKWRASGVF